MLLIQILDSLVIKTLSSDPGGDQESLLETVAEIWEYVIHITVILRGRIDSKIMFEMLG